MFYHFLISQQTIYLHIAGKQLINAKPSWARGKVNKKFPSFSFDYLKNVSENFIRISLA